MLPATRFDEGTASRGKEFKKKKLKKNNKKKKTRSALWTLAEELAIRVSDELIFPRSQVFRLALALRI